MLVLLVQADQYGIGYWRQGGPRINVSDVYGILTPLSRTTVQLLNTLYITKVVICSEIDVRMTVMDIEQEREA